MLLRNPQRLQSPRPIAPALMLSLIGLSSCGWIDVAPPWTDQLQADSPCYGIDLLSGLDRESTDDLHAVFACLNRNGHLDPFLAVDAALDAPNRLGTPLGLDLVRAGESLGDIDVDPIAMAGSAADLFASERPLITSTIDLTVEMIYGLPAPVVRSDLGTADLSSSLLTPLAETLPIVTTAALDDPDAPLRSDLADALRSDTSRRLAQTLRAILQSEDPAVAAAVKDLPARMGDALAVVLLEEFERRPQDTGNLLRDAATVWLDAGDTLFPQMLDATGTLLNDQDFRRNLRAALLDLAERGILEDLIEQVSFLSSIDPDGGAVDPGERSVLASLLHLLEHTNQPVECSIDIGFTNIDLDLGNMAVSFMDILAKQDPRSVVSATRILDGLLGTGVSEAALASLAKSNSCPAITPEVVRDLEAVRRLDDPRAKDLFTAIITLLRAVRDADRDHFAGLADLVSEVSASGVMEQTDAVLRVVGPTQLPRQLAQLVPVLITPSEYDLPMNGVEPVNFDDLLDTLADATLSTGDATAWDAIDDVARAVVLSDGTWETMERATPLLRHSKSVLQRSDEIAADWLAQDPDVAALDILADAIETPNLMRSTMLAVEAGALTDAMLAERPTVEGQEEAPLAYVGRLMVDGTLDDLFAMIDLTLASLQLDPAPEP